MHDTTTPRPTDLPVPATPDLMRAAEVCDLLRLPAETLRSWRKQRRGPRALTLGRRIYYRRTEVQAWLEHNLVPDEAPTDRPAA